MSLLHPPATHLSCLLCRDDGIQRCDAKQPCTTCLRLDGGADCVYEQSRIMQRKGEKLPADAQAFLFSFKCKPSPSDSSSSWVTSEDASLSASNPSSPEAMASPTPQPSSPVPPEMSRYSGCDAPEELSSPNRQKQSNLETQLVSLRGESPNNHQTDGTPTLSFAFSPLSSVPRPLPLSFPLLNPEHFQISDTTSSESDLSLCVFSWCSISAR